VHDVTREALVSRLSDYERVVEIGIGRRTGVARALAAAGLSVVATDIRWRAVPPGVRFVVDDVTDPDRSVYADADALYARNLPPELQRPALSLARDVGAPLLFTTLGTDPAVVPASREPIPRGTLFVGDPQRV
jgi:uncharacterized UPF0146 family protein